MKKSFWLGLFIAVVLVAMPLVSASAQDTVQYTVPGTDAATMDKMAVDPQSWVLQRDMGWKDNLPNPVVDWLTELNPAGLFNPTGASYGQPKEIIGGLVLVDYLDRPFISGKPRGSDVLGYLMYNEETGEYDMEQGVVRNPVISILDFPDRYPNGYGDLAQFWQDYLNDPSFTVANHGVTINGFWREATYGKWAADVHAYGVYTLPFFEFELMGSYMGSFNTYNDIPPSFRYGNPTQTSPSTSGSGNGRGSGLDAHIREISKQGAADVPGNAYGLPQGIRGLQRSQPTPYADFDFFFNLHSGYCTSGSWQPFGVLQFPTRQDVTTHLTPGFAEGLYADLGPMGRLKIVEEFFNTYPEWIPIYAARYQDGWANNTGAWAANQYSASDPVAVARVAEYRNTRFWIETLAAYNAAVAAGQKYTFKLPKEDMDWADAYHAARDYVGRAHVKNTRYVSFTSWEGSVGEWSHAQLPPGTSGGTGWGQTGAGKSLPYSTQGENSGVGTFAHEFGHVSGWPDNYGSPWADSRSPATENWDIMSRGSFGGPYGDLARWAVPGIEGGTVPMLPTFGLKLRGAGPDTSRLNSFYDPGDVLAVSKQGLAGSTPVVAEIISSNVPMNTQYNDFGVPRGKFYKALQLNFGSGTWADTATLVSNAASNGTSGGGNAEFRTRAVAMGLEVVERSGYTSYAHDSGVLLSRVSNLSNGARDIIDSHVYDIDMADFFENTINPNVRVGNWTRYVVAHATQQADALFKAGKSYTDTGYYGSIRQVAAGNNIRSFPTTFTAGFQDGLGGNGRVLVPGSVKKGEAQDGRPIASGDTVNEWRDEANKLHFYILQKNVNPGKYGDFLSYVVGVRHDDGLAVGGELKLEEPAALVPAKVGNFAKQTFTLTNTGNATDIVRVKLEGALGKGRFQTIQVPWNGGLPSSVNEAGDAYTFNPNNREIFKDRVVPTFFSEQNAVVLNDLYAVGAGETIEIEVFVRTTTGAASDFDLKVVASSETNPAKVAEAALNVIVDATASAKVTKLNGNKNDLTITVNEFYNDGAMEVYTKTFSIDNNAAGTYDVAGYKVYVDTKGNDQIRACYVDFDASSPVNKKAALKAEPEKVDSVTVAAVVTKQSGNTNSLTITLTEFYNTGKKELYTKTFSISNNGSGTFEVGGYKVFVETKGNDQIRACYVV